MKVKQWVASVTASFDEFVSKIENHEAVAESVIADVRKAAARLRSQRSRLQSELARTRTNAERARQAATTWEKRALSLPQEEETRALECVARAEQESARAAAAEQQIIQSEAVIADIDRALSDVEAQLTELKLRKSTLSSRNTRADVLAAGQGFVQREDVDSVFERWEQTVIEKEYAEDATPVSSVDEFEQPFATAERASALKQRLAALRKDEEASQ